jgi:hypothetical protein
MNEPSSRQPYPNDTADDEWAFVALSFPATPLNATIRFARSSTLRAAVGRPLPPLAVILDSRTLQSSPESVHRAGDDGAKRRKGSKVQAAVATLGHLLALHVTPANARTVPRSRSSPSWSRR